VAKGVEGREVEGGGWGGGHCGDGGRWWGREGLGLVCGLCGLAGLVGLRGLRGLRGLIEFTEIR